MVYLSFGLQLIALSSVQRRGKRWLLTKNEAKAFLWRMTIRGKDVRSEYPEMCLPKANVNRAELRYGLSKPETPFIVRFESIQPRFAWKLHGGHCCDCGRRLVGSISLGCSKSF